MKKRSSSPCCGVAAALALVVLPATAQAEGQCDALRRIVALDGDFSSIAGALLEDDVNPGDRKATIVLEGADCKVPNTYGNGPSLYACAWIDTANDAAADDGQTAHLAQLRTLVQTCFPQAGIDARRTNENGTAFALPKVYIIVGAPPGAGVILMVASKSLFSVGDAPK